MMPEKEEKTKEEKKDYKKDDKKDEKKDDKDDKTDDKKGETKEEKKKDKQTEELDLKAPPALSFTLEPRSLNFWPPVSEARLQLKNTSDKKMAVKVKVSNTKIFKVYPEQQDEKDEDEKKHQDKRDDKPFARPAELNWSELGGARHFDITNPGPRRAFKIKCSNNNIYRFPVVFWIAESGQVKRLDVARIPAPNKGDWIEVVYCDVPDRSIHDAQAAFKDKTLKTESIIIRTGFI
ncbi:unnamed protein product, partial [Mesorhabditis spiculigera]